MDIGCANFWARFSTYSTHWRLHYTPLALGIAPHASPHVVVCRRSLGSTAQSTGAPAMHDHSCIAVHNQSTGLLEQSTLWGQPYLVRLAILLRDVNRVLVARQAGKTLSAAQSPSAIQASGTQRTRTLPMVAHVGNQHGVALAPAFSSAFYSDLHFPPGRRTVLQHECGPSSCTV